MKEKKRQARDLIRVFKGDDYVHGLGCFERLGEQFGNTWMSSVGRRRWRRRGLGVSGPRGRMRNACVVRRYNGR